MIDIKLLRENPEIVRQSQTKRGLSEKQVDDFFKLDERWRELKAKTDQLRARRNKVSEEINSAKKQGKKIDELLKEAKEIPGKLEEAERVMKDVEEKRNLLWREIPNIPDKSVLVGDATKNKVLNVYGKPTKFNFKIKDHADLLEGLNLLDTNKAAEVSGARFYYLKGDLVRLNFAIICFALDFLRKQGFTLMQPPYMLRKEALEGAIPLGAF